MERSVPLGGQSQLPAMERRIHVSCSKQALWASFLHHHRAPRSALLSPGIQRLSSTWSFKVSHCATSDHEGGNEDTFGVRVEGFAAASNGSHGYKHFPVHASTTGRSVNNV